MRSSEREIELRMMQALFPRRACHTILTKYYFDQFILVCILLNTVALAMQTSAINRHYGAAILCDT